MDCLSPRKCNLNDSHHWKDKIFFIGDENIMQMTWIEIFINIYIEILHRYFCKCFTFVFIFWVHLLDHHTFYGYILKSSWRMRHIDVSENFRANAGLHYKRTFFLRWKNLTFFYKNLLLSFIKYNKMVLFWHKRCYIYISKMWKKFLVDQLLIDMAPPMGSSPLRFLSVPLLPVDFAKSFLTLVSVQYWIRGWSGNICILR